MKVDYGDKLLMAFARRRPWRFAVLISFACLGGGKLAADLSLAAFDYRPDPGIPYVLAFCFAVPRLILDRRPKRHRL